MRHNHSKAVFPVLAFIFLSVVFFTPTLHSLPKDPLKYYLNYIHSNQEGLFWLYPNQDTDLARLLTNTGSSLEQIIRTNSIKNAQDLKKRKYLFIPYDQVILSWNPYRYRFERTHRRWRTVDHIYYFTYYNGIQLYEDSIVGGYLYSGYGYRKDPFTGKYSYHHGWDIACIKNTPVYINFSAYVKKTGRDSIKGNYIILSYKEFFFEVHLYHLNQIFVKPDQIVDPDTLIALTGNTGKSSGAHLHFGLVNKNTTLNPAYFYYFVSGELKYIYKLYAYKKRLKKRVLQKI